MKTTLLAVALMTLGGQASALDCIFGNTATAFAQAQQNGEPLRVVIGSLTWQSADIATHGGMLRMEYEGQEYDVPARFVGEELLENGERIPIDEDIRVQTWCANGDCGYATDAGKMLSFLNETPGGPVMNAYPCQSYPMLATTRNILAVGSCLSGVNCEE